MSAEREAEGADEGEEGGGEEEEGGDARARQRGGVRG